MSVASNWHITQIATFFIRGMCECSFYTCHEPLRPERMKKKKKINQTDSPQNVYRVILEICNTLIKYIDLN